MADRMDVSDKTAISMPMRNLISILAAGRKAEREVGRRTRSEAGRKAERGTEREAKKGTLWKRRGTQRGERTGKLGRKTEMKAGR